MVSLLFMLGRTQNPVNQGGHGITKGAGPPAVVSSIVLIQLLVVNMIRRHVRFVGNI